MQFYTNNGRLTAYSLSCGYFEIKYEDLTEISTSLWREHSTYHVRQHNHKEGKRIFWDSFDTLTEARKRYDKA